MRVQSRPPAGVMIARRLDAAEQRDLEAETGRKAESAVFVRPAGALRSGPRPAGVDLGAVPFALRAGAADDATADDATLKAALDLARAASMFVVDHLWQNDIARLAVKGGWLIHDAFGVVKDWNDPEKGTLACLVSTGKLANNAAGLLRSDRLLGPDWFPDRAALDDFGTLLTVSGDALGGTPAAITALKLKFGAEAKADPQVRLLKDSYGLAAKLAAAGLSRDPAFADIRLEPIPWIKPKG